MEAVAADVGNGDAELGVGEDSDEGAFAVVEVNGFADVPGFARGVLLFEAGFLDEFDKGSGGAVGDGGLVGVHFDEGIVDAHADEGGEDMLDRVDPVAPYGKSRSALDGFDEVDIGWDEGFVREVDAAENEAVVDRERV